eukprot:TRINITY_DN3218_c0_g1_i1.p1 TRINITY_DN3218_c0_g1~~TRINITY_DN3218_c0_g1_i1.p1  ORF type:complete len:272 (-),score=76.73 TRINITY_DN3218_c0_g1_i1:64-879(-)
MGALLCAAALAAAPAWGAPGECRGTYWDGAVNFSQPLSLFPVGNKLVRAVVFTCLELHITEHRDACGNYDLALVNGLNDFFHLSLEMEAAQLSNSSFNQSYSARVPTPWNFIYTNTNAGCAAQRIRLTFGLAGNPEDHLCPAPDNIECHGHGLCSMRSEQCVCYDDDVRGHWACVGGAPRLAQPCSCTACRVGYNGTDCLQYIGRPFPWTTLLFGLANAAALASLTVIGVLVWRRRKNPERAPLLTPDLALFTVGVNVRSDAPNVRTKLFF